MSNILAANVIESFISITLPLLIGSLGWMAYNKPEQYERAENLITGFVLGILFVLCTLLSIESVSLSFLSDVPFKEPQPKITEFLTAHTKRVVLFGAMIWPLVCIHFLFPSFFVNSQNRREKLFISIFAVTFIYSFYFFIKTNSELDKLTPNISDDVKFSIAEAKAQLENMVYWVLFTLLIPIVIIKMGKIIHYVKTGENKGI